MDPIRCPRCNYMMAPSDRACSRCGTELEGRHIVVQALGAGVAAMFLPMFAFFKFRDWHRSFGFLDILVIVGLITGVVGVAWAMSDRIKDARSEQGPE